MKLLKITYKNPKGDNKIGKFIETTIGFIPINLDEVTYLDKSNRIISIEEIDLEHINKEMFL
jgi:hypothetical protein